MSLGVVIEGMAMAAFVILLLGGKQRREQGWAVLSIMVAIAALVQAGSMSLTVSQTGFLSAHGLGNSYGTDALAGIFV